MSVSSMYGRHGRWFAFLLATVLAATAPSARAASPFPDNPAVVDVTRPPYNARGDGRTDDTDALQAAMDENVGRNRVLYLPEGTYLVSRTLTWPKRWKGRDNWGFTWIRGRDRVRSVLRLRDGTFRDTSKPQAILWCGGFGSADWFHNYVENLGFDVGKDNPGAVGLQFYSNNSGAVRDCRFVAGGGVGWIGLDLAHRDMNGPLLVRNCEVFGFRRGVVAGRAVNSQTFEHLVLAGQAEFGFDNAGQTVSVRGLASTNAVPAIRTYGAFTLLEARLNGREGAADVPAVINYNGGRLYLRDVAAPGYRRTLADVATPDFAAAYRLGPGGNPAGAGPRVDEYPSHPPVQPHGGGVWTPLPIEETPGSPEDPVETWADVDRFGADPTGAQDSSEAIQRAVDSGASTVFLPGSYRLERTVVLRGAVRRMLGLGGTVNYGKGLHPDFRLGDGDGRAFHFEHLSHVGGGLEVDTARTLVVRSVSDCDLRSTPRATGGRLFAEDFVTHDLRLRGQRLWARQLNIENEGTHLRNDAGDVWILGYKTERGGTVLHAAGGGRSEVLGGFSYTTTAGRLAPMFVNEDSRVFAVFTEVCYNGDPYRVHVRETRGGVTREVPSGDRKPWFYLGTPAP